jgi:plastocyanin
MRRAGLAAVVAAGLALLPGAAAAGAAPAAKPTGGAAPDCAMHRHSKRVIRHVRSHGQLRTLRRTRHWWSCDPVVPAAIPSGGDATATPAAPQAPASTADPAPAPNPAPEPELEPGPTRLSIKAAEYSYTLSRPTLDAGEVTIELDNRGQDAHNLNLRPVGSEAAPLTIEETGSLTRRRAQLNLEPGTYRLWCSLPTHDEEGMHATLVVEAP